MKKVFVLLGVFLLLGVVAGGGAFLMQQWKLRAALKQLDLARDYLQQGKPSEADQILSRQLQNAKPGPSWVDSGLALRFQALDALKDEAATQALADQVLDPANPLASPGDETWGRAMEKHLIRALDANELDRARELADKLIAQPAGSYGQLVGKLGMARLKMATGMQNEQELIETRNALQAIIKDPAAGASLRLDAEFALSALNMVMLKSRQPYGNDQQYVIAKGDTIYVLARKFKISQELLMLVNGITNASRLTIGQRIKIPDLDFSIVVNKGDNTLTLNNHGEFFKKYRVRTGEHEYQTPPGDYTIRRKVTNPQWTDTKTGKRYEANDPENQLGTRWMEFQGSLGIHEAIDPNTIGTYSSSGCVGLERMDVEELYDLVKVGTPVKIIGSKSGGTVITIPGRNAPAAAAGSAASPAPNADLAVTTGSAPGVILPD